MKATGIVRRIDDLGRVVIPKEIRRTMRIREGDPLEIYTDREGEVIFKKYSPIGELSAFASQYAETLYKTCNMSVIISDRDAVIASAGVSKKEYTEKKLSDGLENVIESRGMYIWREGGERYSAIMDGGSHYVSCAMPIISEGDVVGCVASLSDMASDRAKDAASTEIESKLIMTAASFLGRQMES
ncbi:MAG: AbrB/MazE/SpoVT family DNA-binding domain-containing protein [Clostridia bacterium]|nr:AbrB/MazE/SpoVT family DNA-binding domain-containing protein [Clostridia bacterium]MBQ8850783.1 AbrB/MazE/SpoVT family DNA-binding domain-containing protein [Clostridia bacterium]